MIISIFGCLVSLGMVALAAGGLDPQSGFYDGINRTTFLTHVNHSVYLGLGVLQLTLCVLSDGICAYYLFIERSAQLYRVKDSDTQNHVKHSLDIQRDGKYRSSTGSEVPLVSGEATANSSRRKHNKKCKHRSSEPTDGDVNIQGDLPIPYTAPGSLDRPTLRRQEISWSKASPVRNPYTRSASFSTFGHSNTPDRVSLIVHPTDDNASVAETIANSSTQCTTDTECHYAQTLLFGPPIDEGDALPPYEAVDNPLYRKVDRRRLKRPKSEELNVSSRKSQRTNNASSYGKGKSGKRNRNSQTRSKIPNDRKENQTESDTERKHVSKLSDNADIIARLSRSADLLAFEDERNDMNSSRRHSSIHEQGIYCQDFTHSSELILVSDQAIQLRQKRPQTQSLRVNKEKRLDRRRKALSAEVKLNKDQLLAHERMVTNETRLERRTNSIDGSNSSLFASNRIMPTKFSLRTPVRQIGMPHACSPVPVKPIMTLPLVSPPPKPPRNYSVTAEDLNDLNQDIDGDVENVFADINDLNNFKDDDVFSTDASSGSIDVNRDYIPSNTKHKTSKIAIVQASHTDKSEAADKRNTNSIPRSGPLDTNTGSATLSPVIKLYAGPVLSYVPPNREARLCVDHMDGLNNKDDVKSDLVSIEKSKLERKPQTDTMIIPTSPIMRPPSVPSLKGNKSNPSVEFHANKSTEDVNITGRSKPNGTATHIQKESKSNEMEVVHANVMEEAIPSPISPISSTSPTYLISPTSPTVPISPTSPTSPTAKFQKAIRLLYTFKDQHVSVFDPLGNGKENEDHTVLTIAETLTVQHPVESPTESVQVKKNRGQTDSEKTSARSDSHSNLRVRVPPMSPSERILQRKTMKMESQKAMSVSKEDRPIIIQPTNVLKDFNRSATGARPKSSYRVLFDPLSAPPKHDLSTEEPANNQPNVNKKNKSCIKPIKTDNVVSDISVNYSSPNVTSDNPQRNLVKSQSLTVTTTTYSSIPIPSSRSVMSPSKTFSTTNNVTKSNGIPDTIVQFTPSSPHSATAISKDVPVNRVQAIPVAQSRPSNSPRSSDSQGVLHLPQSQYSRQVSNHTSPPTSAADNYGEVVIVPPPNGNIVQNNAQQHNNNQPNQPLFSVVL